MWNKGPHKCDPVTRYHEYKAFWERHKAPGEKAHKQLRWNVRAQMLQRDDVVAVSLQLQCEISLPLCKGIGAKYYT